MSQLRAFILGGLFVSAVVAAAEVNATWRSARFDEITVGRINIVEPDGTRRFIIANRTQFPGDFYKGKETKRPDRADFAGILFINDEGTENGGLIQNGKEDAGGVANADLSLTFDRFRQDQSLQLIHTDDAQGSRSSIRINDAPSPTVTSIDDLHRINTEINKLSDAEQQAYIQKLRADGRLLQNRIYLGTTKDKASTLVLRDAKGRARMQLTVSADGQPEIQMLDEKGKIVKTVTANE